MGRKRKKGYSQRPSDSRAFELPDETVLAYIALVALFPNPIFPEVSMSTATAVPPAPPSPTPARKKATNIDSMLKEKRVFKPSAKFVKAARIGSFKKYKKLYKAS